MNKETNTIIRTPVGNTENVQGSGKTSSKK